MQRWLACLFVFATVSAAAETSEVQTTLEDRRDVAVTAYNSGLALVRDVRAVTLPTGEVRLRFADVAQRIRPETVGLRTNGGTGVATVLEQNYEYDLISPSKLLEKFVGRGVRLVNFDKKTGFTSVDAELLSVNDGPVYRIGGEIHLNHPGTVAVPELPANLVARPSLVWLVNNSQANPTLELTYLTDGVAWSADYVATFDAKRGRLDLNGWVTLNNTSGATYTSAKLKLVAGDVNLVPRERKLVERFSYDINGDGAAEMMMPKEESFGEYHLYTLARRTTIKENQTKQVALLSAAEVACSKRYEFRGKRAVLLHPDAPASPGDGRRTRRGLSGSSATRRPITSASRFQPARCGSTKPTRMAPFSSRARTRSSTRPKTKRWN